MLLKPILIFIGKTTAYAVDDHKDYGRRKDAPYDDQQKFHAFNLKGPRPLDTQARLSRPKSAEMATNCSKRAGIFAHVPLWRGIAMMEASEKEDAPWMNSVTLRPPPQAAAGSVSLWQPLSSFWSYFTRFSRVAGRQRPLIQQLWAQPTKAPLCLKKPHQSNRSPRLWANKTTTTHKATTKGGRSNAFAFGVLMTAVRDPYTLHTSKIEGSPC